MWKRKVRGSCVYSKIVNCARPAQRTIQFQLLFKLWNWPEITANSQYCCTVYCQCALSDCVKMGFFVRGLYPHSPRIHSIWQKSKAQWCLYVLQPLINTYSNFKSYFYHEIWNSWLFLKKNFIMISTSGIRRIY